MKKLSYFLAVAALSVVALVGCSKSGADENGDATKNSVETSNTGSETVAGTDVEKDDVVEAATEITITHSLGTVTVPVKPKKAVVFDFGILDIIKSLGIDVELAVAVESLPAYLSEYSENVSAGSLKNPDLETLFDFEPEVIFISGRQQDFFADLNEIAPTVFVELDSTKYMEDFKHNVALVADVFGVKELADQKLAEIDQLLATAQAEIASKEDKALILLTNDGNVSVYGKGSRFGFIHDLLGVKAADDNIEASTHGQEANYEYISQVNPDIMFVIDRTQVVAGETDASAALNNDLVNATNAAQNDKIINLDPDYWYLSGGGIISVIEMITSISNAMK